MADFVKVAAVGDVPAGSGKVVEIGGKPVALFNVDGTFYAIDNVCPHMDGPLGEGSLAGKVVTCPWHGWEFDVTSGRNTADAACAVPCFEVKVEGGAVFVKSGPGGS
jgi:NAD(P)H-dependent nitrite reductase small subunit